MYYRGADVAIIFYNDKLQASVETAKKFLEDLKYSGPDNIQYMLVNIDKDFTEQATIQDISMSDLKATLGEAMEGVAPVSAFKVPQITKDNHQVITTEITAKMLNACKVISQLRNGTVHSEQNIPARVLNTLQSHIYDLNNINTQILFGFTAVLSLSAIALALTVLSGGAAFAVGLAGGIGLAGSLCGYGFFSEGKATSTEHSPYADGTPTPMSAV